MQRDRFPFNSMEIQRLRSFREAGNQTSKCVLFGHKTLKILCLSSVRRQEIRVRSSTQPDEEFEVVKVYEVCTKTRIHDVNSTKNFLNFSFFFLLVFTCESSFP